MSGVLFYTPKSQGKGDSMLHLKQYMKLIKYFFVVFFCASTVWAVEVPLTLFPMENYDQQTKTWFPATDPQYHTALLNSSQQAAHFQEFLKNYAAPWDAAWVTEKLIKENLTTTENALLTQLSNTNKAPDDVGYGENFRPYDSIWIEKITDNMNLSQLINVSFNSDQRAIVVENTNLRSLPTHDPHFYRFDLPGQGFPFDNLQLAALWEGLPVYVLGQTKDKAWQLVMISDLIGWVDTNSIAQTNQHFINTWKSAADHQLLAITHTQTTVENSGHQFLSQAYVGTTFPLIDQTISEWKIATPYRDHKGQAHIQHAFIVKQNGSIMPLKSTPENFAVLLETLHQRPYGWGSLYFYNDCASELRNLFTPFGISLPYNSIDQAKVGNSIDISAKSTQERFDFLLNNGHRLMTIVYIKGHVFLYMGNYVNPHDPKHSLMPMTYQDIWGLKPLDQAKESRAVIGGAVFFPLLLSYPEDPSLASELDKKVFQVIYLDK